jgi:hypothetical protein
MIVPESPRDMSNAISELSQELETFRARCFWWVRRDVPLTDLTREVLRHGLQLHGGRAGMALADRL